MGLKIGKAGNGKHGDMIDGGVFKGSKYCFCGFIDDFIGKGSADSKNSHRFSRVESDSTSKFDTDRSGIEKTKLSPRGGKHGYDKDNDNDGKDSAQNSIKLQANNHGSNGNSNIAGGKNLREMNANKPFDKNMSGTKF